MGLYSVDKSVTNGVAHMLPGCRKGVLQVVLIAVQPAATAGYATEVLRRLDAGAVDDAASGVEDGES